MGLGLELHYLVLYLINGGSAFYYKQVFLVHVKGRQINKLINKLYMQLTSLGIPLT